MLNYSSSEENYIKSIYHLQQAKATVMTNELADHLQSSPASITDMLKKLNTRKIVHYRPYRGFRLTQQGNKVALGIIRRHRLWEYFLAEKLNFSWDEVHEVAEQLEHVSSKKLIDKLDEYLGFPKFDPHGDPIPDMNGKIEPIKQVTLCEWPIHEKSIVVQVMDQSTDQLSLLQQKKINIGSRIEILKKNEFDGSMEIRIEKENPVSISDQLSKTILVSHES